MPGGGKSRLAGVAADLLRGGAYPALLLAFALFCLSVAITHPRYLDVGRAHLTGGTARGFTPDSYGWQKVSLYIWHRTLGRPVREGWPPAPTAEETWPPRRLRPIYPLLGVAGLAVWPVDEVFQVVSILSFILSALLLFGIAKLLGQSDGNSFIAAAIFTAGTIPLRASVCAMADSTGLLFLGLAVWTFLRLRDRIDRPIPAAALGVSFLFALLACPLAVLLIPIAVAATVRDRPRLVGSAAALGAGLALYGAYCLAIDYSPIAQWSWARECTIDWHGLDPDMSTSGFYLLAFGRTVRDLATYLRPYGLVIIAAALGLVRPLSAWSAAQRYGVPWFAITLFLLFLWGMRYAGLYSDRFLIYCIPPLSILATEGTHVVTERIARRAWPGSATIVAGGFLVAISPHTWNGIFVASRPLWVWIVMAIGIAAVSLHHLLPRRALV